MRRLAEQDDFGIWVNPIFYLTDNELGFNGVRSTLTELQQSVTFMSVITQSLLDH